MVRNDQSGQGWDDCLRCEMENIMNYPKEIWADTDLVCSDEPKGGHEKYIRACDYNNMMDAISKLIEIVQGPRNVEWAYEMWKLTDMPEWRDFYNEWAKS